jgi:pilus assembly protein Flp/PilA
VNSGFVHQTEYGKQLFNRDVSLLTRSHSSPHPLTGEKTVTKYLFIGKAYVAQYAKSARKFITGKEEGATLAEYGLLLALIAVVCLTAIGLLGTKISSMFTALSTSI